MITTNNLKRKPLGGPQRLTVLTTTKVKPKSLEAIRAGIKAQQEALAKRVDARPTRKVGGPMLVVGGMEGRVQNAKRKLLMAKVRLQRQAEGAKIKKPIETTGTVIIVPPIEIPTEPPTIPDYMKEEPTIWKVAPEKKKRGRPKKETEKST